MNKRKKQDTLKAYYKKKKQHQLQHQLIELIRNSHKKQTIRYNLFKGIGGRCN